MKNKKGFILVETIIVMSVVMIALIGIYNSYITVIKKAKQQLYFDNINDVYRLNVVSEFFSINNVASTTCSENTTCNSLQSTLFPNLKTNENVYIITVPNQTPMNDVLNLSVSFSNSFKRYLQTIEFNSSKNLIILRYIDNEDNEHYVSLSSEV